MKSAISCLSIYSGNSAYSLLSLLLIVVVSSIVLIRASADQTGAAVSDISVSFREELANVPIRHRKDIQDGGKSRSFRESPTASADSKTWNSDSLVRKQGLSDPFQQTTVEHWVSSGRSRNPSLSDEDDVPDDPKSDGAATDFRNLLGELNRFTTVSPVETLGSPISLDLFPSGSVSDEAVAMRVAEQIQQMSSALPDDSFECELTCWSSSPSSSAWMTATTEAAELQKRVSLLVAANGEPTPTIRSCSRIWPSRSEPRPRLTITVRRIQSVDARQ